MRLSILLRRPLKRSQGVAPFSEVKLCNICKYAGSVAVIALWPEYKCISSSSETEQDTQLKFSDHGDYIKSERRKSTAMS